MTQTASSVILIRPIGFGFDPETAASNAFQRRVEDAAIRDRAAEEFDALLDALRHAGVYATVLDPADPAAPNAVFPNNWFSTHADGRVMRYPMATASRRVERLTEVERALRAEGFQVREITDMSPWERAERYLEGTGSLVLDRTAKRAYACLSPRTAEVVLEDWCGRVMFEPLAFKATMDGSPEAPPVYHTNVVMSIGEAFAVVCFDAMPLQEHRDLVRKELERAGKEVIPISLEQMGRYVGNMLQLCARDGKSKPIMMSETAFLALRPEQRLALERHGPLAPVAIPTIEAVGGGSVRCMIAENFLGRL